jgi:hypothetical protein
VKFISVHHTTHHALQLPPPLLAIGVGVGLALGDGDGEGDGDGDGDGDGVGAAPTKKTTGTLLVPAVTPFERLLKRTTLPTVAVDPKIPVPADVIVSGQLIVRNLVVPAVTVTSLLLPVVVPSPVLPPTE